MLTYYIYIWYLYDEHGKHDDKILSNNALYDVSYLNFVISTYNSPDTDEIKGLPRNILAIHQIRIYFLRTTFG